VHEGIWLAAEFVGPFRITPEVQLIRIKKQ